MAEPIKWQDKARKVEEYHINQLKKSKHWSIRDTAKFLRVSSTQVWKMLYLARGLYLYPSCAKLEVAKDAALFIREMDGGKKVGWKFSGDI